MKQYLFVVILTATITLVLAWAVWQLSMRYKLYPGIRERDVHKTPTPRLGGVAQYVYCEHAHEHVLHMSEAGKYARAFAFAFAFARAFACASA